MFLINGWRVGKINFFFKMAFTPSRCVWEPCPPVGLWEHLSEGKRKKREGGRGGEKEEEDRGCNRLSTLYTTTLTCRQWLKRRGRPPSYGYST